MPLIPPEPEVVAPAAAYARQRAEAIHGAAPAAAIAHVYGYRCKVFVASMDITTQREIARNFGNTLVPLWQFYGQRSSSGATGRKITVVLWGYGRTDARLTLSVAEDNIAGGASASQVLEEIQPEAVDLSSLGIGADGLAMMEREAHQIEVVTGFTPWRRGEGGGRRVADISHLDAVPLVARWTYRPDAAIGRNYTATLYLKNSGTERDLTRLTGLLVHEAVITDTAGA